MHAFYGNQELKSGLIEQMRGHRLADQVRHGFYWQNGKGCAVGCAIHTDSNPHAECERRYGVPRLLVKLQDRIFEGLPSPEDVYWGERFWEAVPVGADLSLVWPQFALALLSDPGHGVLRYVQAERFTRQKGAIEAVVAYYRKWVDTQKKPADVAYAHAAADAAADAAAAHAAADAIAADYAIAAADYAIAADASDYAIAAADAAADYAADAADYAAADAAKKNARIWQSEILLKFLRDAPVVQEQ